MSSGDYFIGFMLVFLFWLLLLLLEIILNMRNTIIELSFFSDEKPFAMDKLDNDLNKKFGVKFQTPFEMLEFLLIGYIAYEFIMDLRYQGLQIDAASLNQIIIFFVVIMSVMVGDMILIMKDLHIYKFIKNYSTLNGKKTNN
ncbi:hypothetical protein FD29_GL002207 [Companilactobacillus mindensis DSM 14500]|jgi:hypothetical protein|uniref:Uncharacterized protein n=2 Tax=Companilactobacillus mindensis TaxID=167481 RepID=A0A0R1QLH7_9LACO|nr:hypothetical protein FD29_GL002207 [Companilactobacillus mindensis DSM 14500]GEO78891.1 hypothetical protein LMI01_12220 [Companilactobacillus mindensis]